MDYEKPKKTSMMQTDLKIQSKNLYLFFDAKLVKFIENAQEFPFQMDSGKPKKWPVWYCTTDSLLSA